MAEKQLIITFYQLNSDPKFVEALKYMIGVGAFAGDHLITFGRHLSFLKDEKFANCLRENPEKQAMALAWRLHTACWAAQTALGIDGDFVQFGVQDAMSSTMIVKYLDFQEVDKDFYLYDTFSGIPAKYLSDQTKRFDHPGYHEKGIYEKVVDRFSSYENVKVTKGFLPEKLEEICPEKISFLYMDLGNFPSERDTLKYVIDKMTNGGIILFEGYGWESYKMWKIEEEDFVKKANLNWLELPTGQGLAIIRK